MSRGRCETAAHMSNFILGLNGFRPNVAERTKFRQIRVLPINPALAEMPCITALIDTSARAPSCKYCRRPYVGAMAKMASDLNGAISCPLSGNRKNPHYDDI